MRARRKIVYCDTIPSTEQLANRTISNVPLARLLILRDQASVTMRLCAGLSCTEFALLARPRATSRATDSLYLFKSGFLGLHGRSLWGNPEKKKWSILHSDIGWLLNTCAVKRRWSTAGESPARELGSLHPEAIGAAVEETKPSEPPV
jgi:hypothetical protein